MTQLDYLDKILHRNNEIITSLESIVNDLKELQESILTRLDYLLLGIFIGFGFYLCFSILKNVGDRI